MPNRLALSTSPYLLQHQDNPVDWWEWSQAAFDEARTRDVPVLLSVGYAACHWCHVMAHESFEDPDTAQQMNRDFVNVKVDREERPDVDAIYMESVQAMTGQGGWPMTVFLDHDGRPFFAGTYFPKVPHHGMPSFRQLLAAMTSAWVTRRDEVDQQAAQMVVAISSQIPASPLPDETGLGEGYRKIEAVYDPVNGGFGTAPKFPQQPVLDFLLRVRDEKWAPGATEMISTALEKMAAGGIHDHLGGGFARYSVDNKWLVPHFEKMLYDNAQLARLYLWAGIELDRADFISVARKTLEYMATDLRHPDGGFFSSEDADSEGEEGKFYVWSVDEIREVLGDEADELIVHYGVTPDGNFEGHNILHLDGPEPAHLEGARRKLLERRARRVRPGLDDKVIASWNGLAIRAFAEAGAVLEDERYLDLASAAGTFALDNLMVEGRLMRSWRDGRTSVPGFVDDYGSMAVGLYSLFAATADESWYQAAVSLVEQLERFARPEGGFFTTAEDGEHLVKRPFDVTDNPLPSSNALAAEAMFLASRYTGRAEWGSDLTRALEAGAVFMERYPSMVGHHLSLTYSMGRARELAIVGPEWRKLAAVAHTRYRPHVVVAPATTGTTTVPLLDGRQVSDGAQAYVCRDFVCDLPTSDPKVLADQLTR